MKLKDACVENSIFSKVSLYLKPVGLLITIFLTKWTVKNPIGTFLFTIPFYTLTCCLSCLIIKFAEVSSFFAHTRHQVVNNFILGYGGVKYNHVGIDRLWDFESNCTFVRLFECKCISLSNCRSRYWRNLYDIAQFR